MAHPEKRKEFNERLLKVSDESNRRGPCFVVRERKITRDVGVIWEWVAWSRTRAEAVSHAHGLGVLIGEEQE